MKSVIVHADGRRIDLAATIDPNTYAELENLTSSRKDPVLRCGGCHGSIYIRHGSTRKDELFGTHFTAGTCAETLIIRKATLSDEHKRQAEYHALAAQRAGHAADLEVTTTGHTRVDVVVDDRIGFEVQRSALSKAAAVDRTARSVAAGLVTVAWFTDRTTSPQSRPTSPPCWSRSRTRCRAPTPISRTPPGPRRAKATAAVRSGPSAPRPLTGSTGRTPPRSSASAATPVPPPGPGPAKRSPTASQASRQDSPDLATWPSTPGSTGASRTASTEQARYYDVS